MTVSWTTAAMLMVGLVTFAATALLGPMAGLDDTMLHYALGAIATLTGLAAGLGNKLMGATPSPTLEKDKPSDPPPANGGGGTLGLLFAAMIVATLHTATGCGASAIQLHARAATVSAASFIAAGAIVDEARDSALDRVEAENPEHGEARAAAIEAEAARWRPAGQALDAAREVILTWIQAIDLARIAGDEEGLLPELVRLAMRVVNLYDRITTLLQELGVTDVPVLPATIRQLVGGAS